MMKKNMGNTDRLVRIVIAIILAALFITDKVEGALGYVALAVSAIFLLTSLISFCPLYAIFGISTCKVKE